MGSTRCNISVSMRPQTLTQPYKKCTENPRKKSTDNFSTPPIVRNYRYSYRNVKVLGEAVNAKELGVPGSRSKWGHSVKRSVQGYLDDRVESRLAARQCE
eukprot:5548688-Amphidinium_carterae.5